MRGGLKAVSHRRDDALARLKWDRLEHVVADHYRDRGYQVEHCGTGASRNRFDGGIDLKLRRDGEYILVQCKHWNACKVTHNPVHELFGVMTGEGATGAILVTSGEFSKAAIDAAARLHGVQLIDGDELRAMIGVLPEEAVDPFARTSGQGRAEAFVASAAQRLVAAAEDRIRNGGALRRQARDRAAQELVRMVLKFAFAIAMLWFVGSQLQGIVKSVAPVRAANASATPTQDRQRQLVPAMGRPQSAPAAPWPSNRPSSARPAPMAVVNDLDEAQLREWRRKNAESMKALESTPELPLVLPAEKPVNR